MKKSLIALMLGGMGIGTTEFVMMGLLEDIARDLAITIPQAGHLISAYALGVVIGAPLLVLLAGNYPPKRLLVRLMILFTGFNALSMLATSYEFLFATRLLAGLPHGAFFGVGAVVASRLADKGKEAQAVSIMFAGLTLANIACVPLGTYVGHHFSWRYAFAMIAFMGFVTLISLHFWMPQIQKKQNPVAGQLAFFRKGQAWLLILTIATGTGGLFCWISYIGPLLTRISGFSEDHISYILVLAGVGMLLGNWIGGVLADRFSPAYTVIGLLLCMACSLVLVYLLSANKVTSLVMTFVTGAAAFSLIAPVQILMINTAKGAELLAAAVSQAAFNIGNALGAYLGGLPLQHHYPYNAPELVGVGMALAGAVMAMLFVFRNRQELKTENVMA